MTCPSCGSLVPPDPVVQTLTICSTCLRSLVIIDGGCRLAIDADTVVLSDGQRANLRKARKAAREAQS